MAVILLAINVENVKGFDGIEPIPREDLYQDYFQTSDKECRPGNVKTRGQWIKCLKTSPYHQDYACRYINFIHRTCYCCGKVFHYIEYGKVCTKFCLLESTEEPRYGQDRLIELPFNWGSYPEKITLDNKEQTQLKITSEEVGEEALESNFGEQESSNDWRTTTVKSRVNPSSSLPLAITNKTTKRTTTKTTTLLTRRPTQNFERTTTTTTTTTSTTTVSTRRPTVKYIANGKVGRPVIVEPQISASSILKNEKVNTVRDVADLREQEGPKLKLEYLQDRRQQLIFSR